MGSSSWKPSFFAADAIWRVAFGRTSLACGLVLALLGSSCSADEKDPLVLEKQGSFFVGGAPFFSKTLSTIPQFLDPNGNFDVNQMYVHYEIPVTSKKHYPITFVHGCCLTGKSWEETPDGRMGWDDFFVRKGYPIYVVDQAQRGRSSTNPDEVNANYLGSNTPKDLPQALMASHEASWLIFRIGPKVDVPYDGVQFPLDYQDQFWKQMVPDWSLALPKPNPTVVSMGTLADQLGGTIFISHSEAGAYPFETVLMGNKNVKAIVAIEPVCTVPTTDLTPLTTIPILVLWGDYVEQSPRWAPALKLCTGLVDAINKAGGKAVQIQLPDVGIKGNTHMMMVDKNSLTVAEWLAVYMEKTFPRP